MSVIQLTGRPAFFIVISLLVMAAAGIMQKGKGYIARTFNGSATPITATHTFRQGKPNNGLLTLQIKRATYRDWETVGLS